ncbi:hypothetical protein FHS31_000216 [Sphingomonas vulcanisoli]|uniref:TonB-dependent receptor n=1 Tax=Sphingomonas vulcanisoli TaxID=1658060 RepID=A0ABX0TR70_9SPHN|nr:hypothetical protein [Sphingomonas vulcanisoli]NIJ06634.1 hypothetical protein [Sphingomonas vulcanisoli]
MSAGVPTAAIGAAPPARGNPLEPEPSVPNSLQDDIIVTARPHTDVHTEIPPEVSLNNVVIQSLGAVDLTEVFKELAPELGTSPAAPDEQSRAPIVLVNGQRIAGFSSIKDFPPESVARIDIFPDTVALQYGYGPGQRVVNVVLRDNYRALTLVGRYTAAPENWHNIYRTKIDLIRIGETSHWNAGLDFSHQDALYAGTTVAAPGAVPSGTQIPNHTLASQTDHLTAAGTVNRMIGATNAELNASLDLDSVQSRPGLSQIDADLLTSQGLSDLISGPYHRLDQTVHAGTSLTLNGKAARWRWSAIGRLDETTRETRTTSAFGDGGLDTILLPSPGLLGDRCATLAAAGCVSTTTRRASGDFYLNGDLGSLPGGAITAAVRTGFAFSDIRSVSPQQAAVLRRDEGSAQGNLDFPLTSRDSPIGKLTVGVDGAAHPVSAFGTLTDVGGTFDWQPIRAIDFLASYSHGTQAPTLLQLGQAALTTPDLREYDFVTSGTAIVQRTEGGTTNLIAGNADVMKARLQAKPLPAANLTLSAEYTLQRAHDPVVSVTAVTAETMAALPSRFTRRNGNLTALDVTPINAARRSSQQIRWGINYATGFGSYWPNKDGSPSTRRDQFQIALYDTWGLQDKIRLVDGQPTLNLLDGDFISDTGGTPTHRVELQTSIATHAMSLDVSGVWQTPTSEHDALNPANDLTFSNGITLNLRWQINLADQRWLTHLFPRIKGNLNLSADNVLGARLRVHDRLGNVPSAYSEAYLNPTGRTFRITLRKRFRS